jgi:hypothetical protein
VRGGGAGVGRLDGKVGRVGKETRVNGGVTWDTELLLTSNIEVVQMLSLWSRKRKVPEVVHWNGE